MTEGLEFESQKGPDFSFLHFVLTGSRPTQIYAPAAFPPEERAPCTHWIGVWVGPRAGLDFICMSFLFLV
jgi:hypothetical protein